jgi:hypothetical protein
VELLVCVVSVLDMFASMHYKVYVKISYIFIWVSNYTLAVQKFFTLNQLYFTMQIFADIYLLENDITKWHHEQVQLDDCIEPFYTLSV